MAYGDDVDDDNDESDVDEDAEGVQYVPVICGGHRSVLSGEMVISALLTSFFVPLTPTPQPNWLHIGREFSLDHFTYIGLNLVKSIC